VDLNLYEGQECSVAMSNAAAQPTSAGPNSAGSASSALDAGSMIVTGYPGRRLQRILGQRLPTYQTIMQRHVLERIHEHGRSSTDAEVCGVLVGNVYRDLWGLFLLVEDCIRGDRAEGKATQVTFKADTWTHIHEVMERDHPHQKIVGWYHTHPGFGIFLSGMDLFIQDNFFNLPWQVAFVYDPIGGDEGAFIWRQGKPLREQHLVQDVDRKGGAASDEPADSNTAPVQSHNKLPKPRAIGRGTWAVGALGLLLCLIAMYLVLSGKFNQPPPGSFKGTPAAARGH
jgi:proteasome lid subunit RPN8/RPN11